MPTPGEIKQFIETLDKLKAGQIMPMWPYDTEAPTEVMMAQQRAINRFQRYLMLQGALIVIGLIAVLFTIILEIFES
jgi:hypothetical protein